MKKVFITILLLIAAMALAAEPVLKPVAFYLKNLPGPRIGAWSDAQIKTDLEQKGFIFIEVDCSSFPTTSPELEDALCNFHKNCPSVYAEYENDEQDADSKSVFYVPEGYSITKDIPVWNIVDHGAEGSVQRVVDTWNKEIVEMFGVDPVTSADQMYNKDGTPIDWWLRIDIVHPSGSTAEKVPVLFNCSSNSPRMYPFSPLQSGDQILWRSIFPFGFMTSGYAFVNVDHCYNPLARGETWKYFDRYTLEDWNGLAAVTAYVRYLKSHLNDYNLNGKIGVMGISKASYSAVRLADPDNANGSEHFFFNNTPNTKPQPWPGEDSSVDVVYAAAGNGTRRISKYYNSGCVPIITSAGKTDQYGQWDAYPDVVSHLNSVDNIHLDLWMEELGHTYPGKGIDYATGERRYVLFKRFFDHYLKPDAATAADVFYILPKEGATTVDVMGVSRYLPADNYLPAAMLGIAKTAPITVRFLDKIDLSEISAKIKVVESEGGAEVEGEWAASMQGTSFSFTPSAPLTKDASYEIKVPVSLTSIDGHHPSAEVVRTFVVKQDASGGNAPGKLSAKIGPSDDTYSAVAKNTAPKGEMTTLRMRYSTYGDWRFDSYLKFDISGIDTVGLNSAKVFLALSAAISGNIKVNFYTTEGEWSESTLVSANKPTFASAPFDVPVATPETSWMEVNVSTVLRQAIEAGKTSLSIAGRVPDSEDSAINLYVYSKEAENEELRPYLAIYKDVYEGPTTIRTARSQTAGSPVKLEIAVAYETESVSWYVDGQPCGDTITTAVGLHRVKAVVDGGAERGKEIIVKYINVE